MLAPPFFDPVSDRMVADRLPTIGERRYRLVSVELSEIYKISYARPSLSVTLAGHDSEPSGRRCNLLSRIAS
jgi:hypothetical protein